MHVLEELALAEHHLVIQGRRVALWDVGPRDAPACLLIHGFAASRHWWRWTVPALAHSHRVLALDLPGFGDSERPRDYHEAGQLAMLGELLDALDVPAVHAIGHSMGTLVACELAARLPERVVSLVLVGGPIVSVARLFHNPVRTLRQRPEVAAFLAEALTAPLPVPRHARRLVVRRRWARKAALGWYAPAPGALPDDAVEAVLSGVGAPAALPTLLRGFRYDVDSALDAVGDTTTLLVAGRRDRIAPVADLQAFAAARPRARRVVVLENTGHFQMLESPDAFNDTVIAFLDTVEPHPRHAIECRRATAS